MVQIVENHAEICGELVSVAPDPERPGFVQMTVRATDARDVGSWPNLFARDIGQTITVLARADSPAATTAPGPVILKVKKTGPGVSFADD